MLSKIDEQTAEEAIESFEELLALLLVEMDQPVPGPVADIVPRSLQIRSEVRTCEALPGKEKGYILTLVPEHLIRSHGPFVCDPAGMDTQVRKGTGPRGVKALVLHAFHHRSDLSIRSVGCRARFMILQCPAWHFYSAPFMNTNGFATA